ncbi:MAG: serine/threonine protein kinase [Planctomycetaceae bacterium]
MATVQQFGDYEILRFLGRGGMGAVFEARQKSLDRSVALKMLPDWFAGDAAVLDRFRREAGVAAQLDHPNIVPIFAIGQEAGQHFYTMKLIRGLSLAELIQCGPDDTATAALERTRERHESDTTSSDDSGESLIVSPQPAFATESAGILAEYREDRCHFVARVGSHVAQALAFAHQRGKIHRDIKPSNIMVDAHGQAYLIDFGLVRAIEQTGTASFCGTLKYMSPEQIDHADLDARTDIFSLGATLYELIAQVPPFSGSNQVELIRQIQAGKPTRLDVHVPDVPPALAECVHQAMKTDRNHRHNSAAELAAELSTVADSMSATASTQTPPAFHRFVRRGRSRRLYWTGAAVLLLAGGIAGYLWRPVTKPPKRDKPDPYQTSKWGEGVWNGWFADPSAILINSESGPIKHDAARREVFVDCRRGTVVLSVGAIEAASYTIEVDVTPSLEDGGFFQAGIFFGGTKIMLAEGEQLVGQALMIRFPRGAENIEVVRKTITLTQKRVDQKGGGMYAASTPSTIHKQRLNTERRGWFRLAIKVTPKGLTSVHCTTKDGKDGTKELKELVKARYNARVEHRYYRGLFGVVIHAGAAKFGKGRHKVDPTTKQAE